MYFYSIKSPKVTARVTDMQGDPLQVPAAEQPLPGCASLLQLSRLQDNLCHVQALWTRLCCAPCPNARWEPAPAHPAAPEPNVPDFSQLGSSEPSGCSAPPSPSFPPCLPQSTQHTTHSCRESQDPPEASQARGIYRQIASKSDHNLFFSSPRAFATSSP